MIEFCTSLGYFHAKEPYKLVFYGIVCSLQATCLANDDSVNPFVYIVYIYKSHRCSTSLYTIRLM